jgi:hypothetical protein
MVKYSLAVVIRGRDVGSRLGLNEAKAPMAAFPLRAVTVLGTSLKPGSLLALIGKDKP